jgi:UDP-glucose 4-epimerase
MKGYDCVIHLAANADIAASACETDLDLKQTVLATYNVLEAMRRNAINDLIFASGSGVYGNIGDLAPKEDFGPLYPVSMYGATKLSAEALISAYSSLFGIKARVFRFANVIGPNQTHGVAFDFIKRLMNDPSNLQVLGDGYQSKSYIHVDDIIDALILVKQKSLPELINTFNVGTGDYITVRRIVEIVIDEMELSNVKVDYGETPYGWKGDVPVVRLNDDKLRSLGWSPKYSSEEAMRLSIQQMLAGW